jgi:hypothetical protein
MTQKEIIAISILLDRVEAMAKYIGDLKSDAEACMNEKMNYPFLYGYVSQAAIVCAADLKKSVETFKNKIGWKD